MFEGGGKGVGVEEGGLRSSQERATHACTIVLSRGTSSAPRHAGSRYTCATLRRSSRHSPCRTFSWCAAGFLLLAS